MSRNWYRSRNVHIPLLGVAVAALAGAHVGARPDTNQPARYAVVDVVADTPCRDDQDAQTIVYTSLRPGNLDVFLFDAAGGDPRRLTDHPDMDYNAVLSSDGRWVVFASDRDGGTNLYALDLITGDEPVRLTAHPAMDDAPSLAPDGSRLAWVSTRGGNPDIWMMPFAPGDSTAESQAINLTDHPHGDFNPSFSPDGSRIAFSSNRAIYERDDPERRLPPTESLTDIYVMSADGSGVERVVSNSGASGSPAWTADGAALLYYRRTGLRSSAVFRTELNGGRTQQLSPEGMVALTPTAGPDGSVIFAGFDGRALPQGLSALQPSGGRLYRVAADGTGLTPLSEAGRTFLKPRYDAASGRLAAYGDGPVDEAVRMQNGTPVTWPGTVPMVRLHDRCVRLHAMRSYFPSLDARNGRVVAVQWVHEANGEPPGPSAIISTALDGSELRHIYPPPDDGFMWSPVVTRNGEWVFFAKGPRFGAVDDDVGIWKVRIDGTGAVHLTAGSDANDAFPDVSADGAWVVFRSGRDGEPGSGRDGVKEVYLMDGNGGQVRRVTHAGANSTMPAISPDGTRVVYSTTRDGHGWKLWIQSLTDPTDEGRALEPDRALREGRDMHPRFSPDGKWIVFASDRAGLMDEIALSGMFPQPYGELFAIPADGSGPAVRLTHDKWEDALPYWAGPPAQPR
jgi:TolB protein